MRCPYCYEKLTNEQGDIVSKVIDIQECDVNKNNILKGDLYIDVFDPSLDVELGFYCGNCGGFLTTDETKAEKILKDNTDDILQVDENEKIEASAKLFNVINHLHINRDDFIEGMLKDIFGR